MTMPRRLFGTLAVWIFCLFIAGILGGAGLVWLSGDFYFLMGAMGAGAEALFVALPACAIAASVSLQRREPCFWRSLTVLLLSVVILAFAGPFAYDVLTSPAPLFH